MEKQVLDYVGSKEFSDFSADRQCRGRKNYKVYLIDNFTQDVLIIPEVRATHGQMIAKILQSNRSDINITSFNTGLVRGLAWIINDLRNRGCVDAVISSAPGSNYTYEQVSRLLGGHILLGPENILHNQKRLRKILYSIAFNGFPSVAWLEQLDMNSIKLKEDAVKFVFIEALGKFNIPVVLPYGNPDTKHRGSVKNINLLSLATNARVYSGLDQTGSRIPEYPYSPLASGEEKAVYSVVECPYKLDPLKAAIDINEDGVFDFIFTRSGKIPYHDKTGVLNYAPSVVPWEKFETILGASDIRDLKTKELVLTRDQFAMLKKRYGSIYAFTSDKPYFWLNSKKHGSFYSFQAQCRKRGVISGTSLIPPNKLKELLPPMQHSP